MDDDALLLAVIDGGSFRAAAAASGLDPSRVSRRIAALEDRLGVKLLNRTTRASAPTEAGARYAEGVRRLSEARAALLAEVTGGQDRPRGRLRVTAPADFGTRFVAPVLSRMSDRYPELSVDLTLGSGFADLLAEGIDVAVRIGRLSDSALTARRIGQSHRALVGVPELAMKVHTPGDLAAIPFISYRPGLTEMPVACELDGRRYEVRMPSRLGVNSMSAVRAMVLEGRGAHLGPAWAFDEDIARGRLVRLLPQAHFDAFPIYAVWPPTPFQPAAPRTFVADIAEALKAAGLT
ncbi:LysR family transcriptional regulator [Jannaschia aquimarina]|uniref:DmlR_4 protein n=1 Tax=Jannaschia aquimarina TaxID=935700 RepID=A0A0D1EFZ5_9RHOB|nr:LysR family transcriptional regulator [Jannaschia aquimarina]KIT16604.1 HTH-type transcriptional regulator DmlR [Jannaschia aquimarina]SNT44328.1 DNA-binding transcriptional regulator, LysR family [Jannaschia aquimarina]